MIEVVRGNHAVIKLLIQLLVKDSLDDGDKSGKTDERPDLDLSRSLTRPIINNTLTVLL